MKCLTTLIGTMLVALALGVASASADVSLNLDTGSSSGEQAADADAPVCVLSDCGGSSTDDSTATADVDAPVTVGDDGIDAPVDVDLAATVRTTQPRRSTPRRSTWTSTPALPAR